MNERPNLNKNLDGKTFRSYYYLKEELVSFCRENNLPVSGKKPELTDRIVYFLDTGKTLKTQTKSKPKTSAGTIIESTLIEPNIAFSEKLRAFFEEKSARAFLLMSGFRNG